MTKIISLSKLYAIRHTLFASKVVVLATGVFDVLHTEHRKFLKSAKQIGDILIVGLETDERVRQSKGQHRPINTLKIRLRNLVQLHVADYVFSLPNDFDHQTSRVRFVQKLHPHILAVSEKSPFIEKKRELMALVNGQVKIVLPHNPQISTSLILAESEKAG